MRWIVASLLVINVVVFAGQMLWPESETPRASSPGGDELDLGDAEPLRLLNELEAETLRAMRAQKQRAQAQTQVSDAATDEPLCTLVGPFSRLLRAEYMEERIQALEAEAEVRQLEVPGEPAYWVYLPAEDSSREGLERLRELQAKGIDSYLIPKGELANGISLGMFSREELAQQRQAAMQEAGYEAELTQITRTYEEIYVVLPPGEAGKIADEAWQRMLAASEDDGLDRRQNFCPPVASQDNIQ